MTANLRKIGFWLLILATISTALISCPAGASSYSQYLHNHMSHQLPAKNSADCCYLKADLSGAIESKSYFFINILLLLFVLTGIIKFKEIAIYTCYYFHLIKKGGGDNSFKLYLKLFSLGLLNPKTW